MRIVSASAKTIKIDYQVSSNKHWVLNWHPPLVCATQSQTLIEVSGIL